MSNFSLQDSTYTLTNEISGLSFVLKKSFYIHKILKKISLTKSLFLPKLQGKVNRAFHINYRATNRIDFDVVEKNNSDPTRIVKNLKGFSYSSVTVQYTQLHSEKTKNGMFVGEKNFKY